MSARCAPHLTGQSASGTMAAMSFSFPSLARTGHFIRGHNDVDAAGNPAGGYAVDPTPARPAITFVGGGIQIVTAGVQPAIIVHFQDGPVDRENAEPNGAFVEDLLEIGARRLAFYQESPFACEENAEALEHVRAAIAALVRRRDDRETRGVQGQYKA